MFCVKCGNQIQDNTNFCPRCGNPISKLPTNNASATTQSANTKSSISSKAAGFFKSILPDKGNVSINNTSVNDRFSVKEEKNVIQVSTPLKELVMLSLAERFSIGEKNYPSYLREKYGIGFPSEIMTKLANEGYIRPSFAKESLSKLKIPELKDIAIKFDLAVKGKKEELCNRIIENVSEEELSNYVTERYWVLTDKGSERLSQNKYIGFYLDNHSYSWNTIGLDFNSYIKLFEKKPNGSIRDVVWGEFNRRSLQFYDKAVKEGNFYEYCELLRVMALFLEEEKRYLDALYSYMTYIHYRSDYGAAIAALKYYLSLKREADAINHFFNVAEMAPYDAEKIVSISEAAGYNSNTLHTFMKVAFAKENDEGVFSPAEMADFVMLGLNGDRDGQRRMCEKAMKSAIKHVKK